jgi:hypothetical protein
MGMEQIRVDLQRFREGDPSGEEGIQELASIRRFGPQPNCLAWTPGVGHYGIFRMVWDKVVEEKYSEIMSDA